MILRLTKTLSEKLKITLGESVAAENRYCDWFLNLIYGGDRKFYILFTNAFSAFSLVLPVKGIKNKKDLCTAFSSELKSYFKSRGLKNQFEKFIESNLQSVTFTKTNNRSVLGTMNCMAELFPWQLKKAGNPEDQKNRFLLNDDINKSPYKCAATGEKNYIFPEKFILSEKMQELVPEKVLNSALKKEKQIYKLNVELTDYKPKIFRTLYVPADIKMSQLAYTLMSIFNAEGSHLYKFVVPVKELKEHELKQSGKTKAEIEIALRFLQDIEIESYVDTRMNELDADFFRTELKMSPPEKWASRKVTLEKFVSQGFLILYFDYDFGDGWEIKISIENTNAASSVSIKKLPYVEDGAGYGIIEDCGGTGGLEEIRKAFEKNLAKNMNSIVSGLEEKM